MKKFSFSIMSYRAGILSTLGLAALSACTRYDIPSPQTGGAEQRLLTLEDVARIMSRLPIQDEHLEEVYDAVGASTGNGYDEEYMMSDLFGSPGSGVGDTGTRAERYSRPLRDLFEAYFTSTKAGPAEAEDWLSSLKESDIQIYWPYSEDWDGKTYPIVTFDPGYGAESNYGYEISFDDGGARVVDSVLVTEAVARERPVWVINRNDDAQFSPFEPAARQAAAAIPAGSEDRDSDGYILTVKSFKTLRNYDSWFAGGSEFFVKCGAPDGFRAAKDADLLLYTPSVTDFMVKVKRSQVGREIPFDALLLSDYTPQMETIAFLITEDDGGTITSWKCSATVKYKSKSFGFDMEIPYRDKDDIVWRGELSREFFLKGGNREVTGRFGDVIVTFRLE